MNLNGLFQGDLTEEENLARFDEEVGRSGMFRVYREVEGRYLHLLPSNEVKACRIDRILSPTQKTINAGWSIGPIGIEAKAGGHKVGPPLCQAMDYRRAAFRMPGGFDVILRWVFLYPLGKMTGPIESVMAQNGLGVCFWGHHDNLIFSADGRRVIQTYGDHDVRNMPQSGGKLGSR
jgi:hypothetical protein